jgi:hypothetical protein
LFPGNDNPFVNQFQWAELTVGGTSFKDIIINTAPGYFGSPYMVNPFTTSMPSYYSYLLAPQYEMSQMDVKWEDGWELLYLNTGYFPNGDDFDNLPSTNPFAPSAVKQDGIDVYEMNKVLLQKVEELTLYLIQLQEQVNELKDEK